MNASTFEDLAVARKFVFSSSHLIMLEKELLEMSLTLGSDAESILILRDLVDFNYTNAKDSLAIK